MIFSMTEEEWDAVIRVHLKGTFAPSHHAAAYWRERSKAGETVDAPARQHDVGVGSLRQRRSDQLRRRQGRHRRRSPRSPRRSSSRYGVTVNAIASGRAHAPDRRPRDDRRDPPELRADVGGAGDHVVGIARLRRRHRSGHRGVGPRARGGRGLAPRPVDEAGRVARGGRSRSSASCWPTPGRARCSTR